MHFKIVKGTEIEGKDQLLITTEVFAVKFPLHMQNLKRWFAVGKIRQVTHLCPCCIILLCISLVFCWVVTNLKLLVQNFHWSCRRTRCYIISGEGDCCRVLVAYTKHKNAWSCHFDQLWSELKTSTFSYPLNPESSYDVQVMFGAILLFNGEVGSRWNI